MDKKQLRKQFAEIRSSAKTTAADSLICERLLANLPSADTVLLYASCRSEVDTWQTAEKLLERNINIAFPKCRENGVMTFHIVKSLNQLETATYGIREPDISLPVPESDSMVCIVPALAFTEQGFRLGYGGGFYDRFLAEHPEIYTIGLAYEACIAESLPYEKHDIKVTSVITEERTIICNG